MTLTATPRDQVDKSTYDLLELEGGEPNFAYEYEVLDIFPGKFPKVAEFVVHLRDSIIIA